MVIVICFRHYLKLLDNDNLLIMGGSEMEGDLSPSAKATITVTKSNFVQIMKTPVHVTKTAENAENYGGNERLRQRRAILVGDGEGQRVEQRARGRGRRRRARGRRRAHRRGGRALPS